MLQGLGMIRPGPRSIGSFDNSRFVEDQSVAAARRGAKVPALLFEEDNRALRERATHETPRGDPLSRALRSNNFWLGITYVGLIMLIARAYA
jgi:hypothetical protein